MTGSGQLSLPKLKPWPIKICVAGLFTASFLGWHTIANIDIAGQIGSAITTIFQPVDDMEYICTNPTPVEADKLAGFWRLH